MAGFETPINDQTVARALYGLDYQSVTMARSFEQTSRLNAFVDTYVDPETLPYETPDGQILHFDYPRVSAIGEDGSMLHIRLRRQVRGETPDPVYQHIAVIGHIDDPNPANIFPATSEDLVRYDATRLTTFTVATPGPDAIRLVDAPMNQLQWDIEKVLAQEVARASRPLIRICMNEWEYRRSDRHWEKLRDIHGVRERVSRALSQGLGYAALPEVRSEPACDTGQFDQKMVV